MTISATSVRFDDHTMWLELSDGRTLGVPLAWFPRLLRATPVERQQVELSPLGLHWEGIDEDISVAGLLAGRGDVTTRPKDVFGSLPYKGPAKSIADMAAGIATEAKRRHARDRT